MADNTVLPGTGETYAADDIAGVKHQRVKLSVGVAGSAADLSDINRLPVVDTGLAIARGEYIGVEAWDKFGRNEDIDIVSAPQDVWAGGGDYTGFPLGAAETMQVVSSDSNDTAGGTGARTVRISNLIDDTGASSPDIEVTLNGTTPVSLGGILYTRASRLAVLTAGSSGGNEGTITLQHSTTTANVFAAVPVGLNQTVIAAYTVPSGKTLYVNSGFIQMSRQSGAAGSAAVSIRARELGGVFQARKAPDISNSSGYRFSETDFLIFSSGTDIKVRCDVVSDNGTQITAELAGYLADNVV